RPAHPPAAHARRARRRAARRRDGQARRPPLPRARRAPPALVLRRLWRADRGRGRRRAAHAARDRRGPRRRLSPDAAREYPGSMLLAGSIYRLPVVPAPTPAVPVLQFFFPRPTLKLLSGVSLSEEPALLFARHWGLVTLSLGALLIYAASNPVARPAIVLAVLVEKVGYAALVLSRWSRLPKMRGSGLFDALCCLLYARYLLRA